MELHSEQNISQYWILLKGVLRPKLLNVPLASCFLTNLGFLQPYISHLDRSIILPLLVFKTAGLMFSVFFCTLNNKIALFHTLLHSTELHSKKIVSKELESCLLLF